MKDFLIVMDFIVIILLGGLGIGILTHTEPTLKDMYENCILRGGTMAELTHFNDTKTMNKKTELYCATEFKKMQYGKE